MKKERIVRYSAAEIEQKLASGELVDRTDWARVDAMTANDIDRAVVEDPESDLDVDWSKAQVVVPPPKKAISIRIDEDVLAFFKTGGAPYQTWMNAVLRSYMDETKKRRAAKPSGKSAAE